MRRNRYDGVGSTIATIVLAMVVWAVCWFIAGMAFGFTYRIFMAGWNLI